MPTRKPRLFAAYPPTTQQTLMMRWRHGEDQYLEGYFVEAANRLASSFDGEPIDDLILLPYLYLYRHAMELTMKRSILIATRLRRNGGDDDPCLGTTQTVERLKRKHGHRLAALLQELDEHLSRLGLEGVPPSTRRIVHLVGEIDPRGEAFRYAGQLPEGQEFLDFPAMAADISREYRTLAAAEDVLDHHGRLQADYQEELRQLAADMEPDYGDWEG